MARRKTRPAAVCLLVAMFVAIVLTGCGTKTGDQATPGTVAETPGGQDEVPPSAEPQEGQQTDVDDPSADGGGQPADAGETSGNAQPENQGTAGEPVQGPVQGNAQTPANGITIPEVSIEKKPIPENEALAFVKSMKAGWNLGNTFDAVDATWLSNKLDYEKAWVGVKTTEEMVKAVRDAGFNTIRIPVSWHNHVSGDDYKIDREWLDRVQEVVDYAVRNDLYIIINIHHDMGKQYVYPSKDYMEQSSRYVRSIWSQVAERFKDYDHRLIFESLNEPRLVGHKNEWWPDPKDKDINEAVECLNELNQIFVDTVRSTGGNNKDRYLMVPGYCASFAGVTHPDFRMPSDTADNRIILSVHAYTPYNFALQEGGVRTFDINRRSSTNEIDYFMDLLYNSFISKGIPVVIGEFGARDKNSNLQDRVSFMAYYVASATARGMTCIVWDNHAFTGDGELFGLLDRITVKWRYPEIVEAMLKYAQ